MKIMDNFIIKCNNCNNQVEIDKEDLEHIASSNERNMGPEIQHDFTGIYNCDKCSNEISFTISGWEYPSRINNYEDSTIDGGEFVDVPSVDINHENNEFNDNLF